ncbi:cytochrome P450 [Schizophyllum commune Tattone D]|nr:cytochrome P450 [Schizophyllum commune Tattone D]
MDSATQELKPMTAEDIPSLANFYWTVAICWLLYLTFRRGDPYLAALPTVGYSRFPLSYISAFRFLVDADSMIKEGCSRYQDRPFKIANLSRWIVVVGGNSLIEELRRGAEDVLSFSQGTEELAQVRHVFGESIARNPYHNQVLQTQLARNLHSICGDMREEMVAAFNDLIPPSDHEWNTIPALASMTEVISRVTSRVFVGLPLCRDPKYVALCTGFARQAVRAIIILSMTPPFLRPLVARIIWHVQGTVTRMENFLRPLARERSQDGRNSMTEKEFNDLIMWLMNEDNGGEKDKLHDLALRLIASNFAAIHTTSMTFAHALYDLAAHPEYAKYLRMEIQEMVTRGGWRKDTIDGMHLHDSFLRESMRMRALRQLSIMRKTLQPFTFESAAGGPVTIPAGVLVFAATPAVHFDPAEYGDTAHDFEPFRFVPTWLKRYYGIPYTIPPGTEMMEEIIDSHDEGNIFIPTSPRNHLVSASSNFLGWGGGKHQCPGRFFAAVEMKMMLAYIVGRFDVLLEAPDEGEKRGKDEKDVQKEVPAGTKGDGEPTASDSSAKAGVVNWASRSMAVENEGGAVKLGPRPKDSRVEANCFPNPWAKVRMRRREHSIPRWDQVKGLYEYTAP